MSRTSKQQVERAAWWRRPPWPCVVLGVDPAAEAGAALAVPQSTRVDTSGDEEDGYTLLIAREVDTRTRAVEATLEEACEVARARGLQLVVSMESWGAGGRLGINQWLGMGEAVGAWKRAALLMAASGQWRDVLTLSRSILRVQQSTWRSWMVEESGDRSSGKFVPFDSEGWKCAATRACARLFPTLSVEGANAAEAALLAGYTMRSDELGRLLPETYLRARGFEPPPPEPSTSKRRRPRAAGQ